MVTNFLCRIRQTLEKDSMDPLAPETGNVVEDWVTGKDICLHEHEIPDWTALDQPSASSESLGSVTDETEELGTGNIFESLY